MATFAVSELLPGELSVYRRAAGRARLAYKRKHGTCAVPVPDGYRVGGSGATPWEWRDDAARLEVAAETAARAEAWERTHADAYAAAAHRAGVSAVKRTLVKRSEDPRHAADSMARLEVLGLVGRKSTRKPAAPKPAAVESPAVDVAPVPVVESAPVGPAAPVADVPATVPAPMPAMTRAARKASNRELADRMRAAGLTPSGDAWRLAQSGVPLEELAAALSALSPASV